MLPALLVLACTPPPPGTSTPIAGSPGDLLAADPVAHEVPGHLLARELEVRCHRPCTLRVELPAEGVAHRWPLAADTHLVPLHGLAPDADNPLVIEVSDALRTERASLSIPTPPLPFDQLPDLELLTLDPFHDVGGYVVASFERLDGPEWLLAFELATGEVRMAWDPDGNLGDLRREADGNWVGFLGPITRFDPLLRPIASWTETPTSPLDVATSARGSHEAFPLPNGFLTLTVEPRDVPAYPTTYDDPTQLAPARIADPHVVEITLDGTLVRDWSMADRLDPTRIGFDALDVVTGGRDWGHANGVVPTADGGVVASLRHQDALVKLDPSGEVDWILAPPAGWSPPLAERLLSPVGDTLLPYHAHAPHLSEDGAVLTLFDNHNEGHTPYEPQPFPLPWSSRAAAFALDPIAGTFEELWSVRLDPPVQSPAVGDADPIPGSDLVLVDFGFVSAVGGMENRDLGLGLRRVDLLVVDPWDQRVAFHLQASTHVDTLPGGVKCYRAEWVPTLFPPEVVTERLTAPSAAAPGR